jgi:hypothetical protein
MDTPYWKFNMYGGEKQTFLQRNLLFLQIKKEAHIRNLLSLRIQNPGFF